MIVATAELTREDKSLIGSIATSVIANKVEKMEGLLIHFKNVF